MAPFQSRSHVPFTSSFTAIGRPLPPSCQSSPVAPAAFCHLLFFGSFLAHCLVGPAGTGSGSGSGTGSGTISTACPALSTVAEDPQRRNTFQLQASPASASEFRGAKPPRSPARGFISLQRQPDPGLMRRRSRPICAHRHARTCPSATP
ncbi:hypothetical protein HETIRDRAFT_452842 [Heterobasidion irregulare TC 32-1]|uniref:Uncharacterized protein n=1 Tax=Heterobasidion irregulare (strain TC 32-1) TaxID=747525 RepID=W4K1Y3_HETIT|nr:uncharacterized protein HETIRDRAFT_452842 [Heterobasidion irregulare TC 32-1]ETW79749.1 hypothetical protein HETIRDRAFT_452842 [Heterobasidion irregulare TC 32-1]